MPKERDLRNAPPSERAFSTPPWKARRVAGQAIVFCVADAA